MTVIALLHRDSIIKQVSEGVMLDKVAESLGIAAPNISKYLASDPEYQQAREIGAELRLHRSRSALASLAERTDEEGLESAQSNLARVREARLRADQWFCEREFPHRWGQKQTVTVNQGLTLDGALDQIAGAVLDRMKVVSEQSTGQDGQIESETAQEISK